MVGGPPSPPRAGCPPGFFAAGPGSLAGLSPVLRGAAPYGVSPLLKLGTSKHEAHTVTTSHPKEYLSASLKQSALSRPCLMSVFLLAVLPFALLTDCFVTKLCVVLWQKSASPCKRRKKRNSKTAIYFFIGFLP